MAADTTTASELTAEQVQSILVEPLQEASVFLNAGPRIFDTNGSQVRPPRARRATLASPTPTRTYPTIADELSAPSGQLRVEKSV